MPLDVPDVPIPGVDPIENPVWAPIEWITTTGKVRWTANTHGGRCEDCLRCIVDFLNDKAPADTRPPGLARRATWSRHQARHRHIFCEGHQRQRRDKERSDG